MQSIEQKNNVHFNFFEAIDGRLLPNEQILECYDQKKVIEKYKTDLSKGELGCAMSHLSIYNKMIRENIQVAVILEDDIDLTNDFFEIVKAYTHFPTNWELMLLGYYSHTKSERQTFFSLWGQQNINKQYKAVRLIELAFGSHAYMITLKGAEKLTKHLTKIEIPIDHYTGSEQFVNMYAIHPRVARLNSVFKLDSNIEAERKLHKSEGISRLEHHLWRLRKSFLFRYLRTIHRRFWFPKSY